MYAVVEDIRSDAFVVPQSWLNREDDEITTYYPPRSNKNPTKCVKNSSLPTDKWPMIAIKILKEEISSYELAEKALNTRLNHNDTESELESSRMNVFIKREDKKYLTNVTKKRDHEYDFNEMYDIVEVKVIFRLFIIFIRNYLNHLYS